MNNGYVHGYETRESERLSDQANCLAGLLHHDSVFPAGSRILEAGCGVGAQTRIIAPQNPDCSFISMDISETSVAAARAMAEEEGIRNVEFLQGDIHALPFSDASFDHVFVCFVLEHLPRPEAALLALKRVLKPGGLITLIEGDHGSAYFHPDSAAARAAINAQVTLQKEAGGNALIGRELYPLLTGAGFAECRVTPRHVYVDGSRPDLIEGFTRNTFSAMVQGVRKRALEAGLMDAAAFDRGIRDLYRTAAEDGTFCYTFFKGMGRKA